MYNNQEKDTDVRQEEVDYDEDMEEERVPLRPNGLSQPSSKLKRAISLVICGAAIILIVIVMVLFVRSCANGGEAKDLNGSDQSASDLQEELGNTEEDKKEPPIKKVDSSGRESSSESDKHPDEDLDVYLKPNYFNIKINSTPTLKNGEMNLKIQNTKRNSGWCKVDIYTDGESGGINIIYSSPLLSPGESVETAKVDTEILPGKYDAVAKYVLYSDSKGKNEVGVTEIKLKLTVV